MLDCSKMVSRRCRLQSMVVQERNYIEWTNGDTTVNTSDIREEYLFHITSSEFFLLQEKPMGAVSVFMVGNYLNQPFRDLLCFAWCCCFLLCVYSSNELVEVFFSFAGFNLTSDSSWAWSDVSHLLRCRIWFKNQRILRELASLYCAEVLASLFTLQTMVAMSLTPWVHAGLLKDGEPKV